MGCVALGPSRLGVYKPYQFWVLNRVLWMDFYAEKYSTPTEEYVQYSSSPTVVFVQLDPNVAHDLNARYLGAFETDGR